MSFGAVASAYEKYRPGYPEELVDEVLVYTGRPVRTALEIGAGTGKATRVFAGRGIAVTATDPDAAMLTELRKHVPSTVDTVHGAFEKLPLTSTYDLVFAAASLHWTEQAGRWSRVATLLNPDGVFASFGGQMCLADMAVEKAVHSAKAEFLADDGVPSPDGTPEDSQMQWPGTELAGPEVLTLPSGEEVEVGTQLHGGGGYLNVDAVEELFDEEVADAAERCLGEGDEVAVFNPGSEVSVAP